MLRPCDRERGERLFLSQLSLINRVIRHVCARSRMAGADAEDFAASARMKLIENDYAALLAFKGESRLSTYLVVVVKRHLLDFQRARWGTWRPSAEARRGGPDTIYLERLLSRDGYSLDEAYEVLTTSQRRALSRREVEEMASRLPVRLPRRFEDENELASLPAEGPAPDAGLEDIERRRTLSAVRHQLSLALERLPVQDRLLLTLKFEDGRSVAEIAGTLRLDQKKLYRRLDGLLTRLRRELETSGVGADHIDALWSDEADSTNQRSGVTGIPAARPSYDSRTRRGTP